MNEREEWKRLPRREAERLSRQRDDLTSCERSSRWLPEQDIDQHIADIAEALVWIHFQRETPAYRFQTRRQLEGWLRQEQQAVTPETLSEWYGIALNGGEDERLAGWLYVWRAVGREFCHSILRSLDRALEARAPIAVPS